MAMKFIALLLVSSGWAAEAALGTILCPKNYCLKRVKQGDTAASFKCEMYENTGFQCAFEGDPRMCMCDGMVKYGQPMQGAKAAKFTAEKDVSAVTTKTIACNNAEWTDPASGPKMCWCTPKNLVTGKRDTKDPSCDKGRGKPAGYEVPTCIIEEIQTVVTGYSTPAQIGALVNMGYNKVAAQTLLGYTIDTRLGIKQTTSPGAQVLTFDETTLTSVLRIPADNANTVMALLDIERNDAKNPTDLTSVTRAFLTAFKDQLGSLALFKDAINWKWMTQGSSPTDCKPKVCACFCASNMGHCETPVSVECCSQTDTGSASMYQPAAFLFIVFFFQQLL